MGSRALVGRPGLGVVFALALERPDVVERVADAYLEWPEVRRVLDGAVEHLWRAVLVPDDRDGADLPSLDSTQKAWFLLNAGLLRGFNLAAITAWRPSGDSPHALDDLYPGFLGFGEGLVVTATRAGVDLSPPRADDRARVDRVADEARRLIRLGLRQGYGLGFLVDAALGGHWDLGELGWPALSQQARAEAAFAHEDDPARSAQAAAHVQGWGRAERRAPLQALMGSPSARARLEKAAADESRARPLAVPTNLARFSPEFVCTMLAYLMRWWLAVGLRLAPVGADNKRSETRLARRSGRAIRSAAGSASGRWSGQGKTLPTCLPSPPTTESSAGGSLTSPRKWWPSAGSLVERSRTAGASPVCPAAHGVEQAQSAFPGFREPRCGRRGGADLG